MPCKLPPRLPSVLAGVLAAGLMFTVAGCGHVLPLGPDQGPAAMPPSRHLGSPIVMQVVRSQPATATGGCPAGSVGATLLGGPVAHTTHVRGVPVRVVHLGGGHAAKTPAPPPPTAPPPPPPPTACYRPVGTPVTLTSAAVSPVFTYRPPPGQPKGPATYGLTVAVPAADVAAVTAVISQAYDSRGAVGISVAGKLWQAPHVDSPFPGRQFQIDLPSRNQALRLYRLLVPAG